MSPNDPGSVPYDDCNDTACNDGSEDEAVLSEDIADIDSDGSLRVATRPVKRIRRRLEANSETAVTNSSSMPQIPNVSVPAPAKRVKGKTLPSPSPQNLNSFSRQRLSGAGRIANAIQQLSTVTLPSVHERAISVLTDHYSDCLTDLQMVDAYSLMTEKSKAAVFVAMPPNRCRQLWLLKQIGVDVSEI